MQDFVNLRVHSSYSIKDGLLDPKKIIDIAAQNGEKAVAITDLNYMLKAVDFYEYARKKGVKPIIGVDAYIDRDITNPEDFLPENILEFKPTRMLLLAMNEQGYKDINLLLSRGHTENQKEMKELKGYEAVGFIKQSWLTPESTKNIIALSGDAYSGDVITEYIYGSPEKALEKAEFYKKAFNNKFFLELQRYDQEEEYKTITGNLKISHKTGIPLVATHPIQFEKRTDYYNHEIRHCAATKQEVADINRKTLFTREQYYKNKEEINELFSDLPFAVAASSQIADMCNVKLRLNVSDLPNFPTGDKSTEDFLSDVSHKGLQERMLANFPDENIRKQKMKEYEDRLNVELGIINNMGFPGYFLIVYDFIKWAKENDIFVGPGRGSGAGSLVAYSLGITDLDPIPYNLLFERFLNPERVSMPDFDIDFESLRRSEVIDYVHRKYDKNNELSVSQISTFGLLKPKAVIKATSRALQLSYSVTDSISKKIPEDPSLKLEDVLNQDWMIQMRSQSKQVDDWMRICESLENIPTSIGVHAGGVVIGKTQLTDYTPLSRSDMNSPIFTQFDKNSVEKAGLVKFDFLALSNLTVLQQAIGFINEREEFAKKKFTLENLPLDDKAVYQNFKDGNTVGVFQFEGQGMRNTLKLISPDKFEDLISIISLFRPGPIAMIPEYASNKKTGIFEYPHESLKDILSETYGIIVYQEQVMQAAQKVAGYTLGQADMLRRAMGKKKPEEMKKHREIFKKGAEKNGIPEAKANEIFDLMEKFAEYGFNKSHAAAYSLISYQTAYLKTHYPAEYFTAFLNVEILAKTTKNTDKIELLLNDARMNGLKILSPDINTCSSEFSFQKDSIRYGLSGIRNVSATSIDIIRNELKENGKFTSFANFYDRIGLRKKIDKRVITSLIYAGVFDELEDNRAKLIESLPRFIKCRDNIKVYDVNIVENEERKKINVEIEKENEKIDLLNEEVKLFNKSKTATEEDKKELLERILIAKPDYVYEEGSKFKKISKTTLKRMLKIPDITLPELDESVDYWGEVTKYSCEKSVYGFYLTGHPYYSFEKSLDGFKATLPMSEVMLIDPPQEGIQQLVSGVIHSISKGKTRNGDPMWIMKVGDGIDTLDIFAFNYTIDEHESKLKAGEFVSFQCKIKPPRDKSGKNMISIEDVLTYQEVKSKLIKNIDVALQSQQNEELIKIINEHRGAIGVTIYNPENNFKNYAVVELDNKLYGVDGSPDLIRKLENNFGEDRVKVKLHEKMLFSNTYKHKLKF